MDKLAAKYLSKTGRHYNKNFIDKLRIHVKGGTGGKGRPSCGGIGGAGGDVYIVASKDCEMKLNHMLKKFPRKRFAADSGQNSGRKILAGFKGRSIYVQVPHGVDIYDAKTGDHLGEISTSQDKILVARGGKGATYKNNYSNERGESRTLNIDIKLISDLGFIGFPNAGKSSLLRRLSKAKPAVSPFPFTTIKPEIGILEFADHRTISLADLPGIIEGAHLNEGRGHVFLKHAERTKSLLMVADVDGFQLSPQDKPYDCFETIQHIGKELELYDETMLKKPIVLAINKMDLSQSDEIYEETVDKLKYQQEKDTDSVLGRMKFEYILPVSAKSGRGISHLKEAIRGSIDKHFIPKPKLKLAAPAAPLELNEPQTKQVVEEQ